jgi:hypothetical protein
MHQPYDFDDGTGRGCWDCKLRKLERAIHLQDAVSTFLQLKKDYCCFLRQKEGEIAILIVLVDNIYQ